MEHIAQIGSRCNSSQRNDPKTSSGTVVLPSMDCSASTQESMRRHVTPTIGNNYNYQSFSQTPPSPPLSLHETDRSSIGVCVPVSQVSAARHLLNPHIPATDQTPRVLDEVQQSCAPTRLCYTMASECSPTRPTIRYLGEFQGIRIVIFEDQLYALSPLDLRGGSAATYARQGNTKPLCNGVDQETHQDQLKQTLETAVYSGGFPVRNSKDAICKVCSKTFGRSHDLKRHLKIHNPDRPYACKASGCIKAYSSISSLQRHLKSCRHNRKASHECGNCHLAFPQYDSLVK